MSHRCDCEYCEVEEADHNGITSPERPDDYAEVMRTIPAPHKITEERMQKELDALHAEGFRMVEPTPEVWTGVPPRRKSLPARLRRRLSHAVYGWREELAAWICPWDIYDRW